MNKSSLKIVMKATSRRLIAMEIRDHDNLKQQFVSKLLEHKHLVYNYACTLTRNTEEAKDLVQEATLKAYKSFAQLEKQASFKSWMLTIVRNTFINQYRKKVKEPVKVHFDEIEEYVPVPVVQEEEQTFNESLQRSIEQLPENFRSIIHLFYVEGQSYKEMADVLGIPVGTVMSRLYKARQLLKKKLFTVKA